MLYPGLIDAMTEPLGGEKEGAGSTGPGGTERSGPTIRGPQDRPLTTPWVAAVDSLGHDERREKWRKTGFTAAVISPANGFFSGQAAMINLGGSDEPRDTIVATPVALRLNFRLPGRSRSYPGSLMGALSYIGQVFADAQYYTAARAAYRKQPSGLERPTYDRALESVEAAIAEETPFLMPGHLGREIDRAIALAAEYDLPLVIYGAQGAYTRVDEVCHCWFR
jgi:hypothetical protein